MLWQLKWQRYLLVLVHFVSNTTDITEALTLSQFHRITRLLSRASNSSVRVHPLVLKTPDWRDVEEGVEDTPNGGRHDWFAARVACGRPTNSKQQLQWSTATGYHAGYHWLTDWYWLMVHSDPSFLIDQHTVSLSSWLYFIVIIITRRRRRSTQSFFTYSQNTLHWIFQRPRYFYSYIFRHVRSQACAINLR